MNIKRISLILSFILIVILIGAIAVNIGTDNSPDGVTDANDSAKEDTREDTKPDNTETIQILPTGLTEQNGNLTVNEESLLISHRNRLTNESVTVKLDGPTQSYSKTVKRTNQSTFITSTDTESGSARYSEGDYTLINTTTVNDKDRLSAEIGSIESEEFTLINQFDILISNMKVSDYELMEDSVRVKFTTNNSSDVELLYNILSIDSARMTTVIHQDGYIKNASIRIDGDGVDGSRTVRNQNYTADIGKTNIEEPNWVGRAEASNPLVEGKLSLGSNQIVIEHKGLGTVTTEDVEIRILELPSFERDSIELKRQFSKGDSIYLRTTNDGWDVSYNQRPADGIRDIQESVRVTAINTEEQIPEFEITFEQ